MATNVTRNDAVERIQLRRGGFLKLIHSLAIYIFLYACESWTLTAELEKRTQAFQMRYYGRLLIISYKDHVTNEEVHRKLQAEYG